jgi:hypothetical protein
VHAVLGILHVIARDHLAWGHAAAPDACFHCAR